MSVYSMYIDMTIAPKNEAARFNNSGVFLYVSSSGWA